MTKEEMRRKIGELSGEQKEFLKKEIKRQRLETKEQSDQNKENKQEKSKN